MRCAQGACRRSRRVKVDSLYLLIPLSVLLVLGVAALLVWSVMSGQFEDLEREGRRMLDADDAEDRAGR
ncbi:MAG: Cytochrome oxidase maturation protein cbb3-type [Pseudomonadota bacterium]|jgi:cbb3-type cytochrome oxidase maturation protein